MDFIYIYEDWPEGMGFLIEDHAGMFLENFLGPMFHLSGGTHQQQDQTPFPFSVGDGR